MPSWNADLPRMLIIQLARLGDLLQSLPVLSSLREKYPESFFDLLCPFPLESLGECIPGIHQIIPWNGEDWHVLAREWEDTFLQSFPHAVEYFSRFPSIPYSLVYNLNNHPRSILAAHLLGTRVVGAGDQGPLNTNCSPWVEYLRQVAYERGPNRIHLADAFCGICGVKPPRVLPGIQSKDIQLAADLTRVMEDSSTSKIGIVLGAGDNDRRVPVSTWCRLIEASAEHLPNSMCVLIGGAGEREAALALEDKLSPHYHSRLLNCVGRTTLPELVHIFNHCQWVVGSDTGPLHLGVACGARAIGWYFSRARVHETGPYGVGHYVWQHQGNGQSGNCREQLFNHHPENPCTWPINETIELMQGQGSSGGLSGWELWTGHRDDWGMFYLNEEKLDVAIAERKNIWERLSDMPFKQHSALKSHSINTGCSA